MKIEKIDFSQIATEKTSRFDAPFLMFQKDANEDDSYRFLDIFEETIPDSVTDAIYETDFLYAEIGDVTTSGDVIANKLNFSTREIEYESLYKKIEKGDIQSVKAGNIIISKIRPYLKKIIYINDGIENVYFTTAFIQIKPKILDKILYYLLRSKYLPTINAVSRRGKGYPTLNIRDLRSMKFQKADIDKLLSKENELLEKITKIEDSIKNVTLRKETDISIINDVFKKYFSFDYDEFEKQRNIKVYNTSLKDIGSNCEVIFSTKFHRPSATYVHGELERITPSRVKMHINSLKDDFVLGASISPTDFDSKGDTFYVSMASVKNYRVELDDTQRVSSHWANVPKNAAKRLFKNDIIINRSGAAIGKVALVEEDIDAINADFTMRLRLQDYNPLFAYYYFRTCYFQYMIETYNRGLQNKNIYPYVIQDFPLPDLPKEEQLKIVKLIKDRIDKQGQLDEKNLSLRMQIDELLKNALSK